MWRRISASINTWRCRASESWMLPSFSRPIIDPALHGTGMYRKTVVSHHCQSFFFFLIDVIHLNQIMNLCYVNCVYTTGWYSFLFAIPSPPDSANIGSVQVKWPEKPSVGTLQTWSGTADGRIAQAKWPTSRFDDRMEATKCVRFPYPARIVVLTMVREGAMYWFRKARPGTGGREQ